MPLFTHFGKLLVVGTALAVSRACCCSSSSSSSFSSSSSSSFSSFSSGRSSSSTGSSRSSETSSTSSTSSSYESSESGTSCPSAPSCEPCYYPVPAGYENGCIIYECRYSVGPGCPGSSSSSRSRSSTPRGGWICVDSSSSRSSSSSSSSSGPRGGWICVNVTGSCWQVGADNALLDPDRECQLETIGAVYNYPYWGFPGRVYCNKRDADARTAEILNATTACNRPLTIYPEFIGTDPVCMTGDNPCDTNGGIPPAQAIVTVPAPPKIVQPTNAVYVCDD